jgi:hypothetical protein
MEKDQGMVGPKGLVRWQWEGYPIYHQARTNLLIHIVLVPVFLAGNILLLAGLALRSWPSALIGLAAMVLSFAAQGYGHGRESNSPIPFAGRGFAARCISPCGRGPGRPRRLYESAKKTSL